MAKQAVDVTVEERNPLAKALKILQWFVFEANGAVGVREFSAAFGMAPSTAHRLLAGLAREGYLQQDDAGRYDLGLEMFRLANGATRRVPLSRLATEPMRELVETCNETAFLGIYSRDRLQMMVIQRVDSPHPLRYMTELFNWIPVHAGASGLSIMAFLSDEERASIVARGLKKLTENTIVDKVVLEKQLQTIRRQGYAVSSGQRIVGAVGFGAPIFGSAGNVLGNVNITVPVQRYRKADEARFAKCLLHCTQTITAQMGGARKAA